MFAMVELFIAGGMFMFGILATSLVAVGIIAQRVYTLWLAYRLNVESLRDRLLEHVTDGDYGKAAQLCVAL
jgi:biopolymer transport protein ExbB/TolQ